MIWEGKRDGRAGNSLQLSEGWSYKSGSGQDQTLREKLQGKKISRDIRRNCQTAPRFSFDGGFRVIDQELSVPSNSMVL